MNTETGSQGHTRSNVGSPTGVVAFEGVAIDPSVPESETGPNASQLNSTSTRADQKTNPGGLGGWALIFASEANDMNPMIYRAHMADRKEDLVFREEQIQDVIETLVAIKNEIADVEGQLATNPPTSAMLDSFGACSSGTRQAVIENDYRPNLDPRLKHLSDLKQQKTAYLEERSRLLRKQGEIIKTMKELGSWKKVSARQATNTTASMIRLGDLNHQESAWLRHEEDFIQDPNKQSYFDAEFWMNEKNLLVRLVHWNYRREDAENGSYLVLPWVPLRRIETSLVILGFVLSVMVPAAIILTAGFSVIQSLGVVAVVAVIVATVGTSFNQPPGVLFFVLCAYLAVLMQLVPESAVVPNDVVTL